MTDHIIPAHRSSALIWVNKAIGNKLCYVFSDKYMAATDGVRLHAANIELPTSTPLFIDVKKARKYDPNVDLETHLFKAGEYALSHSDFDRVTDMSNENGIAYNSVVSAKNLREALDGFIGNVRIRVNPHSHRMEVFGTLESGDDGYALINTEHNDSQWFSEWKP